MSAIFDFSSLITVLLLLICTCAYLRELRPSIFEPAEPAPDASGQVCFQSAVSVFSTRMLTVSLSWFPLFLAFLACNHSLLDTTTRSPKETRRLHWILLETQSHRRTTESVCRGGLRHHGGTCAFSFVAHTFGL